MSKGYPDFFGFSIYPKYGIPAYFNETKAGLASLDEYTFTLAEEKGVSFSGFVDIYNTDDTADIWLYFTVDDIDFARIRIRDMLVYNWVRNNNNMVRLTRFDLEDKLYQVAIAPGLPFIESVKLRIANQTANALDITVEFLYYKVE